MHLITLDSDTDFDGWRKAARALVLSDVKPADVTWRVKGNAPDLFSDETAELPEAPVGAFNVPAKFIELASHPAPGPKSLRAALSSALAPEGASRSA